MNLALGFGLQKSSIGSSVNQSVQLLDYDLIDQSELDLYRFTANVVQNPKNKNILIQTYTKGVGHEGGAGKALTMRKSTDKGLTWGVESDIYVPVVNFATQEQSTGYDSNGRLHVIIGVMDLTGGVNDIYYLYSDNDGTTWSAPASMDVLLDNATRPIGRPHSPMIEHNGMMLCAFHRINADYTSTERMLLRLVDGTWEAISVEITDTTAKRTEATIIGLGGNNLLMIVRSNTSVLPAGFTWQQFLSTDSGLNWTSQGLIDTYQSTQNAQDCYVGKFQEEEQDVIALYYPRHPATGNRTLNLMFAIPSDLITYGVNGWNLAHRKVLVQHATQVLKYGSAVHYNNNYNARAVFSRLNSNAGDESQLDTFEIDTNDYSDFQSKVYPAVLINETEVNAYIEAIASVDDAVNLQLRRSIDLLKKAGIFAKMKAIYPMIGGTADKHKWNLVNPLDTDAAFRLTFVDGAGAGWTHAATGAKGDGTGAYANTHLQPLTHLTYGTAHAAYYSRTNASEATSIAIGAVTAVSGINPGMRLRLWDGTLAYWWCYRNLTPADNATASHANSLGLFLGNRLNINSNRIDKIGRIISAENVTTAYETVTDLPLFINALNNNGAANSFSARETAWVSIGDGLTELESAIYYNEIQKIQKILNRSV